MRMARMAITIIKHPLTRMANGSGLLKCPTNLFSCFL